MAAKIRLTEKEAIRLGLIVAPPPPTLPDFLQEPPKFGYSREFKSTLIFIAGVILGIYIGILFTPVWR